MPNQTELLCLLSYVVIPFIIGLMMGIAIKKKYTIHRRSRIRLRQNQGEAIVRRAIINNFSPPNYHLLNNLTLPFQDGTTQIDHVLVSTKGIFVIETKDYSGWIFADARSRQWTRVHYYRKDQFQNPIRQNYKHVKAVNALLDFLPLEQIHSVIVFVGLAEFKTPIPKGVVEVEQLEDYLKTFEEDIISQNRLEFCVGRLECHRYAVTRKTDLQHIAYLKKKYSGSALR
jgi:hypothetical protein